MISQTSGVIGTHSLYKTEDFMDLPFDTKQHSQILRLVMRGASICKQCKGLEEDLLSPCLAVVPEREKMMVY